MDMAELNRGSASTRQVTTATPAMLGFRETEISIEGCVNAMSTGSRHIVVRNGPFSRSGLVASVDSMTKGRPNAAFFRLAACVVWRLGP